MQRRRFTQPITLEHPPVEEAERLRTQAERMPAGFERERLLRRARQAETTSHLTEWLTSKGLQPPT